MPSKIRRPWIKILDENGKQLQRCKDVEKASQYLIHDPWPWHPGEPEGEYEYRLFLDGYEYNPPVITVHRGVVSDNDYLKYMDEAEEELRYLIELHQAFYY